MQCTPPSSLCLCIQSAYVHAHWLPMDHYPNVLLFCEYIVPDWGWWHQPKDRLNAWMYNNSTNVITQKGPVSLKSTKYSNAVQSQSDMAAGGKLIKPHCQSAKGTKKKQHNANYKHNLHKHYTHTPANIHYQTYWNMSRIVKGDGKLTLWYTGIYVHFAYFTRDFTTVWYETL